MSTNMARPTLYDPAYCERVIAWGEEGKSITWMAAKLDVSRDTIYEWEKTHVEFSDAISRAKVKAQAHWEDMGEAGLFMREFQGSTWVKSMAARFPAEWREKSGLDLGGSLDLNAKIEKITRRIVDGTDPRDA